MNALQLLLAQRISTGLSRNSITTASKWAESYRIMGGPSFPGPWRFKYHPWLRAMHESKSPFNVGQKSAQMGFTEALLNIVFYHIDIRRTDCLYLLPATVPDARDFSAGRFDPALEMSTHLSKIFSDVKNLGHKRAGSTNLYVRGSRSKSGLKGLPIGFIAFDEVDEMDQENIPLAMERVSGQLEKLIWMISTPTIENEGINKYYNQSTQEHFFFRCPACSKHIELKFPDNIKITADHLLDTSIKDSYYFCNECKVVLPNGKAKSEIMLDGVWRPTGPAVEARGFHINQMYSPTIKPEEIARSFFKAQNDPADEQELYNSKLGVVHTVEGARVDEEMIKDCISGLRRVERYDGKKTVTMGVDVGKWLHFEIDEWLIKPGATGLDVNTFAIPTVLTYGKVASFEELDDLIRKFKVGFTVVDANPERRKAHEFVMRHFGRAKMCFYPRGVSGKQITPAPEVIQAINVDRTAWLDMSLGRFKRGKEGIRLPIDLDHEYRENIKAPIRIYEKDKDGNPFGRYVNGTKPDHYAHARNYAEIALPLSFGFGETTGVYRNAN